MYKFSTTEVLAAAAGFTTKEGRIYLRTSKGLSADVTIQLINFHSAVLREVRLLIAKGVEGA